MLNRRDAMIRLGQAGLVGLSLPTLLEAQHAAGSPAGRKPAKSCILLYLWGGPPQQDMWDMKPEAPEGIRSQFKPIDTVVPGIQICDQMPQVAKHTDKMAILRSYSHVSNVHEVSVYYTLTGQLNPTLAVPRNARTRGDFPTPGSIVSYFSQPGALPASVTVPRPIGHSGVTYMGTHAGFLGPQYDPFEPKPAPVDSRAEAAGSCLELAQGMDATRLQARFGLLKMLEGYDRAMQESPGLAARAGLGEFREQAFRMLTSPEVKTAFDLSREKGTCRDRYGRNEYGESFLLARRLVESGVRLVTVVWLYISPGGAVSNVWDTHGGVGALNNVGGFDQLKTYCLQPFDQAYSALLEDLSQRGLLDETLVVAFGEFGRTPKINGNGGREHWGACQSVVFAGGGIRGGQIYGESDAQAAYPKSDPVSVHDLLATIYCGLGIPHDNVIHDREKRPHRIAEGTPVAALFG